jgi:hypothetical protein
MLIIPAAEPLSLFIEPPKRDTRCQSDPQRITILKFVVVGFDCAG